MKIPGNQIEISKVAGKTGDGKPVVYVLTIGGLHCFFTKKENEIVNLGSAPMMPIARFFAEKEDPSIKWEDEFLLKAEAVEDNLRKSEANRFQRLRKAMFAPVTETDLPADVYMVYAVKKSEIHLMPADELGESLAKGEYSPYDLVRPLNLSEPPVLISQKAELLMKPYVSEAQRRWAHTPTGTKALGGKKKVRHWDKATKGKNLPEKVAKAETYEFVNLNLPPMEKLTAPPTRAGEISPGKQYVGRMHKTGDLIWDGTPEFKKLWTGAVQDNRNAIIRTHAPVFHPMLNKFIDTIISHPDAHTRVSPATKGSSEPPKVRHLLAHLRGERSLISSGVNASDKRVLRLHAIRHPKDSIIELKDDEEPLSIWEYDGNSITHKQRAIRPQESIHINAERKSGIIPPAYKPKSRQK